MILADEPTQGVDVRSRFDIYEALRGKADQGVAMIVKSSDPLELAGFCDRVVVISRGRIVDEIRGEDLTERRIIEGKQPPSLNLERLVSVTLPTCWTAQRRLFGFGEY